MFKSITQFEFNNNNISKLIHNTNFEKRKHEEKIAIHKEEPLNQYDDFFNVPYKNKLLRFKLRVT